MTISSYNQHAKTFFNQYRSVSFEQVHSEWLPQLPSKAGLALDIGAGSGRDAAALADLGWGAVVCRRCAGCPPCYSRCLYKYSEESRTFHNLARQQSPHL